MTRLTPAPGRIMIEDVRPRRPEGTQPVKRVVGEPVVVDARVYADGHDELHVVLTHRGPDERRWTTVAMASTNPGLDRWQATFVPEEVGIHTFQVRAWIDPVATWRHATRRKLEAGVDIASDLLAGAVLLQEAATNGPAANAGPLRQALADLEGGDLSAITADGGPGRPTLEELAHGAMTPGTATLGQRLEALVEEERALFSSWYELFPRSWPPAGEPDRPGRLADVTAQLDTIAELGFDILYLPPIHPIGTAFRKGPDNHPEAGPHDPGSPWAIGGPEGGHEAVHPDLGTPADVAELAAAARERGMDLALDLAFQCSPDHPWVTEHPEWFKHRPDGSIQYAENPPKRYQDIYPFDFEGEAWRSLWDALLEVTLLWCGHGIRTFRVDNPHTKPFAFWERLITEVQRRHPGTIFLAEAFTRPAIMRRLAEVGFTQGYTYFTWRTSTYELTEYFSELSTAPSVDVFRPNAWPTTPDILPWHLQGAPLEQFAIRLVLAATLSPSYGVYGPALDVGENVPAGNGKEEYGRSEKYEQRHWDLTTVPTLRPLMTHLNQVRRQQLALHTLRTLRFCPTGNDGLIAFTKTPHTGLSADPAQPGHAAVLVVVNLDPVGPKAGMVELDLPAVGIDPSLPFEVLDLLGGQSFVWEGPSNYVELHPDRQPAHIFRLSQPPPPEDPMSLSPLSIDVTAGAGR